MTRFVSLDDGSLPKLIFLLFTLLPGVSLAQIEDDAQDRPLPGLIVTYRADEKELFSRYEPAPAMRQTAGQAPDPRLPAKGWSAQWRGTIEILRPGKHRFAVQASGPLEVRIDRQIVLATKGGKAEVVSEPVELKFGLHPITIDFQSAGAGATLALSWESESFGREPLPGYVLGHDRAAPKLTDLFFTGRLAIEEHSCTACHRPDAESPLAASFTTRPGPHLTAAGTRLNATWIYHWLGDPQAIRPEAVMPRMFSNDRRGEIERLAVATFLASQGKPAASEQNLPAKQLQQMTAEGKQLFEQTGCVVCHEKQGHLPARATLQLLGAKTTIDLLSRFIRNPSTIDPAGRMPGFDLSDEQSLKLATYLVQKDFPKSQALQTPEMPKAEELRAVLFPANPSAQAVLEFNTRTVPEHLASYGRRLIGEKRCAACHELKPTGEESPLKAKPAEHDFAAICEQPKGGCLAAQRQAPDVPRFGASLSREAAGEFLRQARVAPGTPAPAEVARLTLARLNCMGCHQRDGAGGLSAELIAKLLTDQTEQNAEMVSPPSLTGVSEKLTSRYLREVLEDHARSRPWMALKMPRFAKELVQPLPAALAALEGVAPQANPKRPEKEPEKENLMLEAGRTLVGAKGFGCTKCHDMLGVASQGTRGPELSFVPRRVNFGWYLRWMTDPQRIQPGTRMPTVFLSGESPHKQVLQGDPEQQRLAVWMYLQRSRGLSPPDGLQSPTINDLADSARPIVMRTFLPGVTPRSMAVRFLNGVHVVYDGQACRLAQSFSGEFLNLSPAWEGRGGMKAGIKGTTFWTAPEGFPWEVTTKEDVPDFAGRGQDTAFGAELPQDGQLHPSRLTFRGYRTRQRGPIFFFDYDLADGQMASFREAVTSLKSDLVQGVLRETAIAAPLGRTVWLNAALCDKPPLWQTADGKSGVLDSAGSSAPADAAITVVQQGQTFVFHLRGVSPGADWCVAPVEGKWRLLVRLPSVDGTHVNLAIVKPLKDGEAAVAEVRRGELGDVSSQ